MKTALVMNRGSVVGRMRKWGCVQKESWGSR